MALHEGHRKRIIQKLHNDNLSEHEYLEVFLFNAIPRKNTNEIASELMFAFGSVSGVFNASMDELCQVKGVGESVAAYIYTSGRLFARYNANLKGRTYPQHYEKADFRAFVDSYYAKEKNEVFDCYFIDKKDKIVFRARHTDFKSDSVNTSPETILKGLVQYKPTALVVVHNHPYGPCTPSPEDDDTTCKIQMMCSMHGTMFCDHFIYSKVGTYSYYESGRMTEISERFSVSKIVARAKEEQKMSL